jgi:pSer/pThr/pTyr-binding forkhead associated (FHA) protein
MDQAYLEFSEDGRPQMVALDADRLSLGRARGNDLCLTTDNMVSGQHAALERRPDGWVIRDLGSSNGTYVNGQRVSGPVTLGPGDEVALGKTRLVFHADRDEPGPAATPSAASGYLDVTGEWEAPTTVPGGPDRAPAAVPRPSSRPRDEGPQAPRVPANPLMGVAQPGKPGPRPNAAPTAEPRRSGRAEFTGSARGMQRRGGGNNNYPILSFRVERYDSSGNRLPPVGVEFPHYRGGQINDGDEVAVAGRWSHGTLRASRVTNLSTGAQIRGLSGSLKAARWVFIVVFFTIFFAIWAVVIVGIIGG